MIEAAMSFYEKVTTKIQDGFGYSDEFPVRVGVDHESESSRSLFAILIDVVLFQVILYADDLVFMSDSIKKYSKKF